MKAKGYLKVQSMDEAIQENMKADSLVIGGGTFVRNSKKEFSNIIDLENLKLSYIKEQGNVIRIGATTTLRELETSELLNVFCDGIIKRSCEVICGVQLRNVATIGGAVAGRYGFSDLLPALLALDSKVRFLDGSTLSLGEYIETRKVTSIIKEIEIRKVSGKASFKYVKRTALDFSIINICIINVDDEYRIAVGARPHVAKRCPGVEQYLNINKIIDDKRIMSYLYKDVSFGSDLKASEEYRETVCASLLIQGIGEVRS